MSHHAGTSAQPKALCSFEYVYFARPDSVVEGRSVHAVRFAMGQQLAKETPVAADVVIGVPDSAIPAAMGFAQASGIPYAEGFTKNRYIGRTFIQPDDRLRQLGIKLKFSTLSHNLAGKRVVLVDDSVVRGNTVAPLIALVREAGATEVHVRVSSPPVKNPCFMGVDMASFEELLANRVPMAQIAQHVGADSMGYLSAQGLVMQSQMTTVNDTVDKTMGLCNACFTGDYPVAVPEWVAVKRVEREAVLQNYVGKSV